jgi:hypothetical protein
MQFTALTNVASIDRGYNLDINKDFVGIFVSNESSNNLLPPPRVLFPAKMDSKHSGMLSCTHLQIRQMALGSRKR